MSTVWSLLRRPLQTLLQEVALGYAWIALVPSWRAGALLLALTLTQPLAGAIGLAGALSAWAAAQLAGADAMQRPVSVFNGLLCGLLVGNDWSGGWSLAFLAVLCGVLSGWLSVVMGRLSWSLLRLPALSMPFALVAMLCSAAGSSFSTLQAQAYVAPVAVWGGRVDAFLSAFGNLYFLSHPLAGVAVLLVLSVFARYYLWLALLGYGTAAGCLQALGAVPEYLAGTAWDSNAILAALLVGGLFATPSIATALSAMLAALFASWLALALGRVLGSAHLQAYSLPFVSAAWLVLYAAVHNARMASRFNLDLPDLPQASLERSRVARARIGNPGSVPLGLPFMGVWTVSQGFSGEHTHRGLWRHALDFVVLKEGRSFTRHGNQLEDFYAYGLTVLSPAYGQVWQVVSHVPDNAPGTINAVDNWGNCVVIRLADGKFVLLAHLKPGSVPVAPGAWVKPGDFLGQCGNSGRSPQPHLHLHVQTAAELGAPTAPFHLVSVMRADADATPDAPHGNTARYELATVPTQRSTLYAALDGDVRPFYLLAGRGLRYHVSRGQSPNHASWEVHCEVDAKGRMALVSNAGARCLVESTWSVFACYERNTVADAYFDQWLLACGYTPASTQVQRWVDTCVPVRLFARRSARAMAVLLWPWLTFGVSRFERHWDLHAQAWLQRGSHMQRVSGLQMRTVATMAPQVGCTRIQVVASGTNTVFQATHSFQRGDLGVPAWEAALAAA